MRHGSAKAPERGAAHAIAPDCARRRRAERRSLDREPVGLAQRHAPAARDVVTVQRAPRSTAAAPAAAPIAELARGRRVGPCGRVGEVSATIPAIGARRDGGAAREHQDGE